MSYDNHMTIQLQACAAGHLQGKFTDQWPSLIDALRWNGQRVPVLLSDARLVCAEVLERKHVSRTCT